jgi:hypothetical protein
MNGMLAATDQSQAILGIVPTGAFVVALIVNVSSLQTKDMNRKSCHATTLMFIAFIIESAAWTVRSFGGGSEAGVFWTVITAAFLHIVSAVIGLRAYWEHRTIGRWPHGRRRATWGFWLNVVAIAAIAAWFYLCANPKIYRRIFE